MKYLAWVFCLVIVSFLAGCRGCPPPNNNNNNQGTTDVCAPEASKTLAVAIKGQETGVWCWAASGEMCMDFLGVDVTQCDEANKRLNRTDCCNNPVPSACVKTGWPEFEKYGFTYERTTDAALTWAQVKDQISCKKKPFAFTWHWVGGSSGHMMVARGYKTENGVNYVYVNNPLPVNVGNVKYETYSNYVSGSDHTHWDDFYDITK